MRPPPTVGSCITHYVRPVRPSVTMSRMGQQIGKSTAVGQTYYKLAAVYLLVFK